MFAKNILMLCWGLAECEECTDTTVDVYPNGNWAVVPNANYMKKRR